MIRVLDTQGPGFHFTGKKFPRSTHSSVVNQMSIRNSWGLNRNVNLQKCKLVTSKLVTSNLFVVALKP